MKELEHQSLMNLHILGSKMGDCAHIAVVRLSAPSSDSLGNRKGLLSQAENQKFRYYNNGFYYHGAIPCFYINFKLILP